MRPIFPFLVAVVNLALCRDSVTDAPPQAALSRDKESPASPAGTARDVVAQQHNEAAWQRLNGIMDGIKTSDPAEVLREAENYRKGEGRRKMPRLAVTLLEAVAEAANHSALPRRHSAAAELQLGHMHLRGEGIEQDVTRAITHYTRSADEGDPDAQHALGVLYSTGFGVDRNPPLAATYLHFAAEGGSVVAQLTSKCTPRRTRRAHVCPRIGCFREREPNQVFFARTTSQWVIDFSSASRRLRLASGPCCTTVLSRKRW